jgi:hypothetical protein
MTKKAHRPSRRSRPRPPAALARVQKDLEIQFRRIAQMQAELDEIKRTIAKRSTE